MTCQFRRIPFGHSSMQLHECFVYCIVKDSYRDSFRIFLLYLLTYYTPRSIVQRSTASLLFFVPILTSGITRFRTGSILVVLLVHYLSHVHLPTVPATNSLMTSNVRAECQSVLFSSKLHCIVYFNHGPHARSCDLVRNG